MNKKNTSRNSIKLEIVTEWNRFEECKQKCESKIASNWYHVEQQINIQLGIKPTVNGNFGKVKVVTVNGPTDLFFGENGN